MKLNVKRPDLPLTKDLDGRHAGETMVVVGAAWYLKQMDLHPLSKLTTIGCNRGLIHPYFRPNYLMVADRRPYIAEMEEGRYEHYADTVTLMFSTSIYDPHIRCHDTPVQIPPKFRWTPWRVTGSSAAPNWKTLSKPLSSFKNIGGPLLQAAVIMGAKRIAMTGIGIVLPKQGGHFYNKCEKWTDWNRRGKSAAGATKCFQQGKKELDKLGIKVFNLSPENGPFEEIFGRYSYERFVKEFC